MLLASKTGKSYSDKEVRISKHCEGHESHQMIYLKVNTVNPDQMCKILLFIHVSSLELYVASFYLYKVPFGVNSLHL